MFLASIISLHPLLHFFLGGVNFGEMLANFDFIGMAFEIINQITFLVDVFIAGAFIGAIVRGIFKRFWKVVWRGAIFIILLVLLIVLAPNFAPYVGNLPIGLKGYADGNEMNYVNLAQTLNGMAVQSGYSAAMAQNFTMVILTNLVIFFGIPALALITPLVSGITFPIFNLLLPKKVRTLKLIPAKLAISLGLTVVAIMVFAIPMATIVPQLTAFKENIVESSLMNKFMGVNYIEFLELFTTQKSIFLKIVDLGNVADNLNFFKTFTADGVKINLADFITELIDKLNQIEYTAPASSGA